MATSKIEQLDQKITKLNTLVDETKVQLRELVQERDQLLAEEAAEARVSQMTGPEKAALLQRLQAEGVESAEAFGEF